MWQKKLWWGVAEQPLSATCMGGIQGGNRWSFHPGLCREKEMESSLSQERKHKADDTHLPYACQRSQSSQSVLPREGVPGAQGYKLDLTRHLAPLLALTFLIHIRKTYWARTGVEDRAQPFPWYHCLMLWWHHNKHLERLKRIWATSRGLWGLVLVCSEVTRGAFLETMWCQESNQDQLYGR